MTYRMPKSLVAVVEAERARGRTDRQIEKIVGLQDGTLSRPYLIDDSEERHRAEVDRRREEQRKEELAFWERQRRPVRTFDGWRPANDCITDRPDAGKHFKPRRA